MKRLIAWILGLVMVFGLAACSSQSPASSPSQQSSQTSALQNSTSESSQPSAPESTPSSESEGTPSSEDAGSSQQTSTSGGKTLVVYFSATGNTETAANYIAQATGADVLQLEPVEPYTDDDLNWNNPDSRVVYEHDNPDERATPLVQDTVENWDEYDTVFIGYPIWWGIAAWPVDTFIQANDFTGKTVIPFCTSTSSGLGESGQLLAEMAQTGDWLEGQRFTSNVSQEDVETWLDGLNLSE